MGLAETAGARRWVSSELVLTENPGRFHYLEQSDLQEKFPRFNMCITAVLLYQYRHYNNIVDGRRAKNEKYVIMITLDPNPTQTLIGMLWGDQCLDAVACDGSRLIRPIWLLCVERLSS